MKRSIKNRVYEVGYVGYGGSTYILASSRKEAKKVFNDTYPKLSITYVHLIRDEAGIL